MNDRLRTTIRGLREYIEKYEIDNERIEEAILHNEAHKNEEMSLNYHKTFNNFSQPNSSNNFNDYSFAKTN